MRRPTLAVMTVVTALLLLACGTGLKPKPKVRTREELKTLLVGKTEQEVIEILGKPERTNEFLGEKMWRYENVTYDPISGRVDPSTWVDFNRDGKVEKLTF